MTRWSAITRPRRSRSALAYGSRSTATAETTSTGSYTTNGDATTGDDTVRSDRIASATHEDLRELVEVVSPELQAIDAFIDSIGEPLPDEAALLGSLAEAALEAKHELERRPGS